MILLDGSRSPLAGLATEVVGGAGELVLYAGVEQHEAVSLGIEGEVLVLQRLAVEADKLALLAKARCELVHDAAVHAAVVVLGALANAGKVEAAEAVAVKVVDCKGEAAFKCCRRTEAGAKGYVAGKNGVETGHLAAALDGLAAHAEDVAGPGLRRLVGLFQAKLGAGVVVE